jgi:hypothetical protein
MKRASFALGTVFLCCASALSQGTKTLLFDRPLGNDPILVLRATEGTTVLQGDGKHFPNRYGWEANFNAGDDWLKDLSLTIKNVSNQPITYLEVSCVLFETSDWQKELAAHNTPANPILGQASKRCGVATGTRFIFGAPWSCFGTRLNEASGVRAGSGTGVHHFG